MLRRFAATAVAVSAAVVLAASGAQAAGTPAWRFAAVFPQVQQLWSVSASSATNAWAVGQDNDDYPCDMCLFASHWNGRKWQVLPEPKGGLYPIVVAASVAAIAPDRAWVFAVSQNDELPYSNLTAAEWTGTSWSAVYSFAGYASLSGVIASGPDDVWAFGSENGAPWVVHYNGKGWSAVSTPLSSFSASGSAAAGDWVMGTVAAQPKRVEILHWSKGAWRNVPLPAISVPKGQQMFPGTVVAVTAANVWATVGVGPASGAVTTALLHWNGKTWSRVLIPKGVSLDGLGSDGHGGIWLASVTSDKSGEVSTQVMYHYSGGRWTHVPGPVKSGFVTSQFGGILELIPGTQSVLETSEQYATLAHPAEGAILEYGP